MTTKTRRSSSKRLEGSLSISKLSTGCIEVAIRDSTSGIVFSRIELSYENFAQAVTGLCDCEGALFVRGLSNVGKVKEIRQAQVKVSSKKLSRLGISAFDQDDLENFLIKTQQEEEGWRIDPYLGSQSSIQYEKGTVILNFAYIRYVTPKKELSC